MERWINVEKEGKEDNLGGGEEKEEGNVRRKKMREGRKERWRDRL